MIPDIEDYIIKDIGERRDKFYKMSCNSCNSDRGYLLKTQDKRPSCNKCSKLGNTVTEKVREKMITGALNRKPRVISQVDGRTCRALSTYARDYGVSKEHRRLRHNIKSLLSNKIRSRNFSKNGRSIFDILGYTAEELKSHLESKFTEGMNWDNYGKWHIDHVVPDSWFKYGSFTCADFKKSWSLNNLQPLWAEENLKKNNRYSGQYRGVSFQKL